MRKTEPEDQVINTIGVTKIDEYIEIIQRHGGTITNPKHAIPGVGWLAYFKDLDGNEGSGMYSLNYRSYFLKANIFYIR